jgi:hypothetical protein
MSNKANCGGCGSACAAGDVCNAGSCSLNCAASATNCGGTCVDTQTDGMNCGGCDSPCSGDPGTLCGGSEANSVYAVCDDVGCGFGSVQIGLVCDQGIDKVSLDAGRTHIGECARNKVSRAVVLMGSNTAEIVV